MQSFFPKIKMNLDVKNNSQEQLLKESVVIGANQTEDSKADQLKTEDDSLDTD